VEHLRRVWRAKTSRNAKAVRRLPAGSGPGAASPTGARKGRAAISPPPAGDRGPARGDGLLRGFFPPTARHVRGNHHRVPRGGGKSMGSLGRTSQQPGEGEGQKRKQADARARHRELLETERVRGFPPRAREEPHQARGYAPENRSRGRASLRAGEPNRWRRGATAEQRPVADLPRRFGSPAHGPPGRTTSRWAWAGRQWGNWPTTRCTDSGPN
jgi:hypothetical protein